MSRSQKIHFINICWIQRIRTRQVMYVQRDIKARSCNNCGSGKSICITNPECVFVAIVIQHAIRMRRFVNCDMSYSTTFFHIKRTPFSKNKRLPNMKCVTWFSLQILSDTFYITSRNERDMTTNCVGLH
jgi:hypothetical protein